MKAVRIMLVVLMCLWNLCHAGSVGAEGIPIKIGVLAPSGAAACKARWDPTAVYLNTCLPGYVVTIIPLSYAEISAAVANSTVDFILLNPSLYVEMEVTYGVSAILTLRNSRFMGGQTRYGGTIFCRADQSSIATLRDLRGSRFMAVNENSFGGWFAVWRELHGHGINPFRDFSSMQFDSTTETVVEAVRDGRVQAGSVRSGELERLIMAGGIKNTAFRILNQQSHSEYPYWHSTQLYPEWPLAKLHRTATGLSKQLSICLLGLKSDSQAARLGDYTGWTTPLNYRTAHDCLMDLHMSPYASYGQVSLGEALRQHWPWIVAMLILMGLLIAITVMVLRLNARLAQTTARLEMELSERRRLEEAQQGLIQDLQMALAQVKTLSGLIPICSNCKKIRDDAGYWHQVEEYIRDHTDAEFSHGLCRDCMLKLYPELYPDDKK